MNNLLVIVALLMSITVSGQLLTPDISDRKMQLKSAQQLALKVVQVYDKIDKIINDRRILEAKEILKNKERLAYHYLGLPSEWIETHRQIRQLRRRVKISKNGVDRMVRYVLSIDPKDLSIRELERFHALIRAHHRHMEAVRKDLYDIILSVTPERNYKETDENHIDGSVRMNDFERVQLAKHRTDKFDQSIKEMNSLLIRLGATLSHRKILHQDERILTRLLIGK